MILNYHLYHHLRRYNLGWTESFTIKGMKEINNVAVLGGGAAGFFAALSVKKHHPQAKVILYEKTTKVLAKVKISGGGRCNVTNS